MKASIVDLRYHMKKVLSALMRNEEVTILYYGKEIGIIKPIIKQTSRSVKEHPFFGMDKNDKRPVEDMVDTLRGERYGDV